MAIALFMGLLTFAACSDDAWGNDNEEMENVYYYGFHDWGKLKNDVKYTVAQGDTMAIPVQFFSEQNKSYNVIVNYYTKSSLTLGADYQVVDANGNALDPVDGNAWTMQWPNARKGIQYIYIKALTGGKTGTVTVQTCDPANPSLTVDSTTIAKTADYEVRGFSQNQRVTVTIK